MGFTKIVMNYASSAAVLYVVVLALYNRDVRPRGSTTMDTD